ncbi:MAG: hypothetical protein KatS3mg121_1041 [Gammaproteobacteria bacterium]|nr:MAG: hypothetical protein KatS3mg121_1041 [Gammaproteobacteria bacterium]
MSVLLGALLLLLALLGVPLFAVIAAGALAGFARQGVDGAVLGIELMRLADMPVLTAIPLFTFAGYLLGESGAPRRLVDLCQALFGWLPGGFVLVALAASALFTAFTGASGVTIVALGALLLPALERLGYPRRFALGLVTTSGSLGLLFAPAVPLILYAVIAQQLDLGLSLRIEDMFLAGLLPGLSMILVLWAWCVRPGAHHRPEPGPRPPLAAALRGAAWELPLPLLVLGGIYGGYIAVSEAAALTAAYVLLITVLVRREVSWRRLPGLARESMTMVGAILLVLGVSLASTNYVIDAGLPMRLFAWIRTHVDGALSFLILLNLFLLALGMLLDIFSALVLMVPLILPVALAYGVDPLHLGVIMLANLQLGYLTPPVGLNLFIAAHRFQADLWTVYRSTLPFFLVLLAVVLLVTYWPALSLAWVG